MPSLQIKVCATETWLSCFLRGIVLYTGDQPVPFGSNLYALPVSALWRTGEIPHEKPKDKT